jgi:hypothetical protein
MVLGRDSPPREGSPKKLTWLFFAGINSSAVSTTKKVIDAMRKDFIIEENFRVTSRGGVSPLYRIWFQKGRTSSLRK